MEVDGGPNQLVATTGALELEGFADLHAVASGGDSTIYRGTQTALDRDVAIKVVNLSAAQEVRRFQREIALTVKLGRAHPNIVTVLDTRTLTDGRPCIVMDFFELGSTHDRLRSAGPFPSEDVISMGRVIADALDFAHAQRVVHRDVKPQNILILPTSYVLADFGIARSVDAGHTSSLDRLSYRHASPEVLDGRSPEPVDDLWSLCSTMATLLEGRAPFAADDPADDTALAYLRRVRTGQRRALPAGIPDGLRALIERGMDPDRVRRFGSAAELIRGLRDLERRTTGWAPGPDAGSPVVPPVPFHAPPAAVAADLPATAESDRDAGSTAPRASRHRAQDPDSEPVRESGPAAVTGPDLPPADADRHDPGGVGDLPAGSDDLMWAPGTAATPTTGPVRTPPTGVTDSETVAAQALSPVVATGPQPVPASAVDRDQDARISAGHARPAAAEPGSPAVSVAQQLARTAAPATGSGAPGPGAAGLGADQDDRTPDAAPTGWRPSTAAGVGDATHDSEDDERPQARVRASIIALAVVMLAISGVVAYFLAKPAERTVTPVTDSPVNAGAGSVSPSELGAIVDQNDPDYTPDILSVKFEGDALVRVTVRGPQAEDATLALFDATNFNQKTHTGNLDPLIHEPVQRAQEGDTVIPAAVSYGRCQTVVFAVVAANTGTGKAGVDYYPIASPECADAGTRSAASSGASRSTG